jgi:hypothetical protein
MRPCTCTHVTGSGAIRECKNCPFKSSPCIPQVEKHCCASPRYRPMSSIFPRRNRARNFPKAEQSRNDAARRQRQDFQRQGGWTSGCRRQQPSSRPPGVRAGQKPAWSPGAGEHLPPGHRQTRGARMWPRGRAGRGGGRAACRGFVQVRSPAPRSNRPPSSGRCRENGLTCSAARGSRERRTASGQHHRHRARERRRLLGILPVEAPRLSQSLTTSGLAGIASQRAPERARWVTGARAPGAGPRGQACVGRGEPAD